MPQIKITDLIDNAVENALARREEALTTEEANQIQGGRLGKRCIIFGGFFLFNK
jgi:hypothetical protein